MKTTAMLLNEVLNVKMLIRRAINIQGVNVPVDLEFQDYANKILEISKGSNSSFIALTSLAANNVLTPEEPAVKSGGVLTESPESFIGSRLINSEPLIIKPLAAVKIEVFTHVWAE